MWDPEDLPWEGINDPDQAHELGLLPEQDTASPYAARWDKRDGASVVDLGWIGEDEEGVWIRRHPLVELTRPPDLWGVVSEYRHGLWRITRRDYDRRSNFELDAKLPLARAHCRERDRQIRGPVSDGDEGRR